MTKTQNNDSPSEATPMPDRRPVCVICRAPANPQWTKSGYQLFQCSACEHLFCNAGDSADHVQAIFGDDYFAGSAVGGYKDYLAQADSLTLQGMKYARLLGRHIEPGRILDIGAAAGFMLKGFVDQGWKGVGIEPNETMAGHARNTLNLDVRCGIVEEVEFTDTFQAATLVQVISHLRDPRACLERIHQVLADHGLLLVETWDRRSWTARMFGRRWHQYNPPSVLHWHTRNQLRNLLEVSGFKVVDQGRPTKWISLGNGVAFIRHALRDSSAGRFLTTPLGWLPRNLKAPYFLDDVFWMLARKQ